MCGFCSHNHIYYNVSENQTYCAYWLPSTSVKPQPFFMTSECFPVKLDKEKGGIDFLSGYWSVGYT